MNVYRLVTKKIEDGEYQTELTCNWKKVDFTPKHPLNKVIDKIRANNIAQMENCPFINKLETSILEDN